MKLQHVFVYALIAALASGYAMIATAQQPAPAPQTSVQPPSGELQLSAPKQVTEEQLRYQFAPHQFGVNGVLQEVYVKLDTYSGKTWRFHASAARWTPIPEPTGDTALESGEESRYELLTHDYYDTYGEEQELIMRVDHVTGATWTYRGATGAWKVVETVN